MRLTFKYRIYPTKSQAVFLNGQLDDACDLYNAALQERREAWRIRRKRISFYDQDKQIKPMRDDGCLVVANFGCAQNVLHRVDWAFNAFFRRARNGVESPGYPRFRSKRRYDSLTFPKYGDGCRILLNGKLRVQGAGHIAIKLHRPIGGTVKTATIKREAGRWFACFSVEHDNVSLPLSSESVGIDVGLTAFATLSNGSEIQNPRFFKNSQAKLRRMQRRAARRVKGSKRRRKVVLLLQRQHIHIRNQRADFAHKESRKIVNRFGLIAVEDLNVKGLAGGMLAKSVRDAAWRQFLQFISYKAEWAGRLNPEVNCKGTSQECVCGAVVPKILSDRWHSCRKCGREGSRDFISSQVILHRAEITRQALTKGLSTHA